MCIPRAINIFYSCFVYAFCSLNLESRLYSKDQFSHAYLSVTIEQFHFAFGVSLLVLNHIKTVFTHLFTNFIRHIMTSKFKQTCNASDSVLFTIISANLACIAKTEGKENIFYWIRFNNSLQFFAVRFVPIFLYINQESEIENSISVYAIKLVSRPICLSVG